MAMKMSQPQYAFLKWLRDSADSPSVVERSKTFYPQTRLSCRCAGWTARNPATNGTVLTEAGRFHLEREEERRAVRGN
jgi:hypothetical protein